VPAKARYLILSHGMLPGAIALRHPGDRPGIVSFPTLSGRSLAGPCL